MPSMARLVKKAHLLRRKWRREAGDARASGGDGGSPRDAAVDDSSDGGATKDAAVYDSGDSDSGSGSDNDSASGSDSNSAGGSDSDSASRDGTDTRGPRLTACQPKRTLREKVSTRPNEAWEVAALKKAEEMGIENELPRLLVYGFKSFRAFETFLVEYSAYHTVGFRVRHSESTAKHNKGVLARRVKKANANAAKKKKAEEKARKQQKGKAKKAKKANSEEPDANKTRTTTVTTATTTHTDGATDDEPEEPLVPEEEFPVFPVYTVVYCCVHGVAQHCRGEGHRNRGSSRLTGCKAQITAQVTQDEETGDWYVQVTQEITTHNHVVSSSVFDTYWRTSDLADDVLYAKVQFAWEMNADPKRVRGHISRELGLTYTQPQWDNLKASARWGADALQGLRSLLGKFTALEGSRCLIIEDDEEVLAGVVMQTSMQRVLFQRWGDSLVLDWTHNTNNVGFYMGSLMVTTASGKGVSVLDFLCSTQTHAMTDAVFAFFIEHNPGACEKLKSVVIDKDYKEWRTLEASFPLSVVVLCIFHVLKYFKFVVTQSKYGFSDETRAAVRRVLRKMVFAPDYDAFAAQQTILAGLLDISQPGHADFLAYMRTYWYSCVDKWSYSGRGYIFTASNTTSNRLESYWNQYKRTLGDRLRVDNCFEAIFIHSASVLRREKGIFADYEAQKPVHAFADPYLQPVLIELSKYAAQLVDASGRVTRRLVRRWRRSPSSGLSRFVLCE